MVLWHILIFIFRNLYKFIFLKNGQNHIFYISRQNTVCHLLAKTMLHVNMPRLPHILVTAGKDGGFQLWQHLEKKYQFHKE